MCEASALKHGGDLAQGIPWGRRVCPEVEAAHVYLCALSLDTDQPVSLTADPAWTEIFDVLSVATIKFEMLSTAPQSQVGLGASHLQGCGCSVHSQCPLQLCSHPPAPPSLQHHLHKGHKEWDFRHV